MVVVASKVGIRPNHPVGKHAQTRISIHPCYKLCRAGPWQGASRGGSGRTGTPLCTMLHTNFREFLFHAIR